MVSLEIQLYIFSNTTNTFAEFIINIYYDELYFTFKGAINATNILFVEPATN